MFSRLCKEHKKKKMDLIKSVIVIESSQLSYLDITKKQKVNTTKIYHEKLCVRVEERDRLSVIGSRNENR